jgi:hypothetical protein
MAPTNELGVHTCSLRSLSDKANSTITKPQHSGHCVLAIYVARMKTGQTLGVSV